MNKEIIINHLKGLGYELGCYDSTMEKLTKAQIKTVLALIGYGSCDVDVLINRKIHVIECSYVDNEIDFQVMSKEDYISTYGNERYEN